VQIAPTFMMAITMSFKLRKNSAFIRETSYKCLDLIPNSGNAITNGIGEEHSIPPPKERGWQDRLLFNAL